MTIGGGLKQSLSILVTHIQSIWSDIAQKRLAHHEPEVFGI
jgi:hypothetical protein